MRFTILAVMALPIQACAQEPQNVQQIAANPPAAYLSCTHDNDCALEPGICGEAMAINKEYQQVYRAASDKANSAIRCIRAGEPVGNFMTRCEDSRCVRIPLAPQQ